MVAAELRRLRLAPGSLLWGIVTVGRRANRCCRGGWMAKDINAVVGERIAAARRRRGWYQRDLAAAIGMSESWVSQVERGVLALDSLEAAEKIANELRLDVPHVLALDVRYGFTAARIAARPTQASRAAAPRAADEDWMTVL